MELEKFLNRDQIAEGVLPHGKRFMFLESAEIVEAGKKAVGKLADRSKPEFEYLKDHFSEFPVFPGPLQMEALAELSGIALISGIEAEENKIGFLVEDHMKYRGMILPGDEVQLEAEIIKFRPSSRLAIGESKVTALIAGKVIAEGEIKFALVDKSQFDNRL